MADLIFVLVLVLFVIVGIKRGFVSTLIGFVSTIISFILSMLLYRPLAILLKASPLYGMIESFVSQSFENETAAAAAVPVAVNIAINAIAFVAMILIVKIIVGILARFAKFTKKVPVFRQANALLGGILGFISGLLVCYIAVGVIMALGTNGTFTEAAESIRGSYLASELIYGNYIRDILLSVMEQ